MDEITLSPARIYAGLQLEELGVPVLLPVRLQDSDNALLAPFGFLTPFICAHRLATVTR